MAHYTELTQDYLEALSDFCNANCELHQGQFEPEILKKRIFDDPSHRNEHGFLLFDNKKIWYDSEIIPEKWKNQEFVKFWYEQMQ